MLVVNGGLGFEVLGFSSTEETSHSPDLSSFKSSSACASESNKDVLFFNCPVVESKSLLPAILIPSSRMSVASNERDSLSNLAFKS